MRNFFENQSGIFQAPANTEAAAIYAYLNEKGDPFDRPGYAQFSKKYFENSGLLKKEPLSPLSPENLLPIEFFKSEHLLRHFWSTEKIVTQTFRSSGTTNQKQSTSPFSDAGLQQYRAGALTAFFAVLGKMFPNKNDPAPKGFSLIPDRRVWTTSSLAQMISWIDEAVGLTFVDDTNIYPQLSGSLSSEQPVWIFGTAFHFVNLIDSGFKILLPKNSLLIDTGGTKGKSRSVDRSELFSMLEDSFSIPSDRIISEYGMSELSAQAYDWRPGNLADRAYQFPAWVETKVLTDSNRLADSGCGALVVNDPLRIDLPLPIRTEDIVELEHNKFRIRRRSRSAPLKGCSLLAERQPTAPITAATTLQKKWITTDNSLDRALFAKTTCSDLLNDPSVHEAFVAEFSSGKLAEFAIEDLRHSLNLSPEELTISAARAIPDSSRSKVWTVIAPNNHSVAAVHPLIMAFIGGLRIAIRIPGQFSGNGTFLIKLLSAMNQHLPGFSTMLASDLEIQTREEIIDNGNVLVFGSNETLNHFAAIAPERISGFGETIAISTGSLSDVEKYSSEIVRDFFSMRQSGCMSPRVFYLWTREKDDLSRAIAILATEAKTYQELLTVDDTAALNGEAIRLKIESGSTLKNGTVAPLVVGAAESDISSPATFVAGKAFAIPIIGSFAPNEACFVNNLKSSFLEKTPTGLLLTSEGILSDSGFADLMKKNRSCLSFRRFGTAQCPKLSGFHEGRPLFSSNL